MFEDEDLSFLPDPPVKKKNKYVTTLTPEEDHKFQSWVTQNKVPFDPTDEKSDYDMRGFWKAMSTGDERARSSINPSDSRIHYPDTWKTPYHKTFSNESIYASPDDPHWDNNKLIDKTGKVVHDESQPQPQKEDLSFLPEPPTAEEDLSFLPEPPLRKKNLKKSFMDVVENPSVPVKKMGASLLDLSTKLTGTGDDRNIIQQNLPRLYGVMKGSAELAEGLSSPENIALMLSLSSSRIPTAIHQIVSGTFGVMMAKDFPALYSQYNNALKQGNTTEAYRLGTLLVGQGLFALIGAKEAIKPTPKLNPMDPTRPSGAATPEETAFKSQMGLTEGTVPPERTLPYNTVRGGAPERLALPAPGQATPDTVDVTQESFKRQVGDYPPPKPTPGRIIGPSGQPIPLDEAALARFRANMESKSKIPPRGGTIQPAESAVRPPTPGQPPLGGSRFKNQHGSVVNPLDAFEGFKDVTSETLDKLKGRVYVSRQFIEDGLKQQGMKQAEIEQVKRVLGDMEGNNIKVEDFANKLKAELLPLKKKAGPGRWKNINLPEEDQEPGIYGEKIYESPVKTSAGNVHFSPLVRHADKVGTGSPGYFAHTRYTDLLKGTRDTRRILEIQSDLMQKGKLENDFDARDFSDEYFNPERVKLTPKEVDKYIIDGKLDVKNAELALEQKRIDYKKERDNKRRQYELLKPFENEWHKRIVREEIKDAAKAGKTKLQFPTGETAMKIEGMDTETIPLRDVGESFHYQGIDWVVKEVEGTVMNIIPTAYANYHYDIQPMSSGVYGETTEYKLLQTRGQFGRNPFIHGIYPSQELAERAKHALEYRHVETIHAGSGSTDTNNPIYKFYESEIPKFLKKIKPEMRQVTDSKGVTWFEVDVTPLDKERPVKNIGSVPADLPLQAFEGFKDITSEVLDRLKGRVYISRQFIEDTLKQQGIKQSEIESVKRVLGEIEGNNIKVEDFANKMRNEMLPLKTKQWSDTAKVVVEDMGTGKTIYSNVVPSSEAYAEGDILRYGERIYESPIKTSAGKVHWNFPSGESYFNQGPKNYFAHSRFENFRGRGRRIIEIQSDLFQKGNLERELENNRYRAVYNNEGIMQDKLRTKDVQASRASEISKLQPFQNEWWKRIIREEIKKAGTDKKKVLQFPTGETAMKTEGLGENNRWVDEKGPLTQDGLVVGKIIAESFNAGMTHVPKEWVITDVLDQGANGEFVAVPKKVYDYTIKNFKHFGDTKSSMMSRYRNSLPEAERFSIGNMDVDHAIYKFYESDVQKFLRKIRPDLQLVKDPQGLSWYETKIGPLDTERPVKNIGASTVPVDIAYAIHDFAKKSEDFSEFVSHVMKTPKLLDRIKQDYPSGGLRTALLNMYKEGKNAELPESSLPDKGMVDNVQRIKLPGVRTLEVDISRTTGKLEKALDNVEAVAKTGTFQPKEMRPGMKYGDTEIDSVTSEKMAERAKSFFVESSRELKRLRQLAQENADEITTESLKLAEQRSKVALAYFLKQRSISGKTLKRYDMPMQEFRDILEFTKQIKDVKPKIAMLDNVILSALRKVSPEIADRWAKGEKFYGMRMDPAPGYIPEDLHVAKSIMNFFRTNLFTLTSFMRDAVDNSLAITTKIPSHVMQDLYSISTGNSPSRIAGIIKSLKSNVTDALLEKKVYKLPEEIEVALGAEVREGVGSTTSVKAGKFPLDLVTAPALKLKRSADILPSRTMALADLVSSAVRDADRQKLEGRARQDFIEQFIKNPPEVAKLSAIDVGRKIKFNVQLSKTERSISGNVVFQLLGDAFPSWGFQFSRWVGRTLGADPTFFKKVKDGKAANHEVIDYLSTALTGWGGVYAINKILAPHIDFNTMEYVDDNKRRTRLSGSSVIPTALLIGAIMEGDIHHAVGALKYSAVPFAGIIAGDPNGLLSNWITASTSYIKGGITSERFQNEVANIVNNLVPGRAVLALIKTLGDPVLRQGMGAGLPGVSKLLKPVINPATGNPLEPKQEFFGVKLPALGGTTIPYARRNQTDLERELQAHGIGLFRSRRTPIAEFETDEIPVDIRQQFKRIAGDYLNRVGSALIGKPGYKKAGFDTQKEVLDKIFSSAQNYAIAKIEAERGHKIKQKVTPIKILNLPKFLTGDKKRYETVGHN